MPVYSHCGNDNADGTKKYSERSFFLRCDVMMWTMGCRRRLKSCLRSSAALLCWLQTTIALSSHTNTVIAFLAASGAPANTTPTRCSALRPLHLLDDTVITSATSSSGTDHSKRQLYLLSLQWTEHDPFLFSKTVTDVWRWKDAILGDGRDFFVPKPQTVTALQQFLKQNNENISECVVLSNCARFEILLVSDNDDDEVDVVSTISSLLVSQVHSYQNKSRFQLPMPLDWPGAVDQDAYKSVMIRSESWHASVKDLSKHWTCLAGPRAICEHVCLVAAGMASRPRRPGRDVVFRPFSSRDAHILLQLKRTIAVADGSTVQTILKYAIQAGKAARRPDQVPALLELRQRYGETGNSKLDVEPPIDVMRRVAEVR
jgi:Glutamyl-tRNAGlu reductase, N-terminal domain